MIDTQAGIKYFISDLNTSQFYSLPDVISGCDCLIICDRVGCWSWLYNCWSSCYLNCTTLLTLRCLRYNYSWRGNWGLLRLLTWASCGLVLSCYNNCTRCWLISSCRWRRVTSKGLLNRRRHLNPRLWNLSRHLWVRGLMRYLWHLKENIKWS